MRILLTTTLLLCLFPLAAPANDQAEDLAGIAVAAAGKAVFSELERELIRDYLREHGSAGQTEALAPPAMGMAANPGGMGVGNSALPPGIAKKLARGGTLPPGIAKRYLPAELERRLPPVARGCERVQVGAEVLLIQLATGLIVDIITS